MKLTAVTIFGNSATRVIEVGTWKAGFGNNLIIKDSDLMRDNIAEIVLRVVVMEVSIGNKNVLKIDLLQL